ncbi:YdbH domain-containing protein [Verrucomicrobiaceae bacterium 5K15]|uniref:YdbH domain-containing protein n=1 Tax=Oceaniferula flava TaxID=2800421 RepID=A0AAE2SC51_9BACT|nr:YdbH domain-containing protein [Oceaniferula flavus]MBK1855158.1 YdbH domain-containing protein [Oceaniferula flavus]MBM1136464.1 YdbH domain-containing protein [Oceaniferula flavus]
MSGTSQEHKAPDSATVHKRRSGWSRFRRGLLVVLGIFVLLVVVLWCFLPRIAEKVLISMIEEAGLEKNTFQVREIGWKSAVIEEVDFADGVWSLSAERVTVDYDALDLLKGRVDQISLEGARCVIDFTPGESSAEVISDEPSSEPQQQETASTPIIHQLPAMVERLGEIQAKQVHLTIQQAERSDQMQWDLSVKAVSDRETAVALASDDFQLKVHLETDQEITDLVLELTEVAPQRFLQSLETLLDLDDGLLPQGMAVGGAALSGGLRFDGDRMEPLHLAGTLSQIDYDGGDQPVLLEIEKAQIQLTQQSDGSGHVLLAGGLDAVAMPLDPSAGFVLGQAKPTDAKWQARIEWGVEQPVLSCEIENLQLRGRYNERLVELDAITLRLEKKGESLTVAGSMVNNGTKLPVHYHHRMTDEERWVLDGEMVLGPVAHAKPMPLLSAITDLFDDCTLTGSSLSTFKFKMGAFLPFEGVLCTTLEDVSVLDRDDLIKVEGLRGVWDLHLVPLSDTDPSQSDPSYYTLDFSADHFHLNSEESLGFNLDHIGDEPWKVRGKGKFSGEPAVLDAVLSGLNLHAESDGEEMDLTDTDVQLRMEGDTLTATGATMLKDNRVPFSYRHEKSNEGDAWKLAGVLQIKAAELKNPIDNAAILIDAMKDKSLTGRVAMKLDFTKGSDEDFDGVLTADIEDGTLKFTTEDGPVIEGIKGGVRLTSMKTKQTAGFHRVTATKMTAFDMTMTNLRADYHLLPNGDIQLRNVATQALGGNVWLDPFVLPDGDANYQFKVRMKKIDIAQMVKLFPEFNGKISGRIDGLLPMQCIDGEFMPQRGGMYLTPGSNATLRYDAGNKFSAGLDPKGREYQQMKMVEDSLQNLELRVLSIRLFDPRDVDKAVVLRLEGRAPTVEGSPPIILNINGFQPDDDTVDFFDLLLKHRDKLNFGL